jgi:hypothetical protein
MKMFVLLQYSNAETSRPNIQFDYEMFPEKKKTYDTAGR